MTLLILLWLACAAFAVWRVARDFDEVRLKGLLLCLFGGPMAVILVFVMWAYENPVIWRKKEK